MKVKFLVAMALLVSFLTVVAGVQRAEAADLVGPYIFKSSMHIRAHHWLVYWTTPTAKEPQYLTGSWTPEFDFNLQGPLEGGSQLSVTFLKPDGSKWLTRNLVTPEVAADAFELFNSNLLDLEKYALPIAGTFTIKIDMSNALTKANKTLFTGKFDVVKFHYGTGTKEKNQADYYVNHDWELPIGQLGFDTQIDAEAPQLRVNMWFRGKVEATGIAGYLYFNGKQISSTKTNGNSYQTFVTQPSIATGDIQWSRHSLLFSNVSEKRNGMSANDYPDKIWLDKNPQGERILI